MELMLKDLNELKDKYYTNLASLTVELRQYKRKDLKGAGKIMLASGTGVEVIDYIRNVEKAIKDVEEKIEVVNDLIAEKVE